MSRSSPIEVVKNSPVVAICGVVADVSAVLAILLLDGVRSWVANNPIILYFGAITFATIALFSLDKVYRVANKWRAELALEKDAHTATIRALNEQLKEKDDEIAERGLASAAKDKIAAGEISRLKERIARLESVPTERDVQAFRELLEEFPFNRGYIAYLDWSFNPKHWVTSDARPLYSFLSAREEWFFDNPEVDAAFKEFYAKCDALASWMSHEAASTDLTDDDPPESIYTTKTGNYRTGGWEEYQQELAKARGLASEVIAARRKLEQVGRANRL